MSTSISKCIQTYLYISTCELPARLARSQPLAPRIEPPPASCPPDKGVCSFESSCQFYGVGCIFVHASPIYACKACQICMCLTFRYSKQDTNDARRCGVPRRHRRRRAYPGPARTFRHRPCSRGTLSRPVLKPALPAFQLSVPFVDPEGLPKDMTRWRAS